MAQLLYYIIINEFINLNYEFLTICTLLSLSSQVHFIPNRSDPIYTYEEIISYTVIISHCDPNLHIRRNHFLYNPLSIVCHHLTFVFLLS